MSYKQGDEIHLEDDDASAGEKTGHVRWILAISLLAAIALLSAIWIFGAFSQDDVESEPTVTGKADAMQDDSADTDGVIAGEDTLTPSEVEESGIEGGPMDGSEETATE